ncbi:MAG: GTPase Era [Syntrophomonadaceae bacterium]|nr:GTPase Era [Syntrophomonadaceae bacterium]
MATKSGFVSIVGRPNVGKSTLLNSIIGRKVAIVSDKPQTTRNRIQGIYTTERGQIIFVDTPGIHKPKHRLGEYMADITSRALREVDLILYVVDASVPPGVGEDYIINNLINLEPPVFLVPNKIDLVDESQVMNLIQQLGTKMKFAEVIPVSATMNRNLDRLVDALFDYLPEGPLYYPEGEYTDQPERFIIAELIREKALYLTREEVPHSLAVEIEDFEPRNHLIYVRATIYTERESQKGIVIGKNGSMLKKIGQMARQDIENLLGSQVYLELWVKVKKDWRNNETQLKNLVYRF